MTSNNQVVANAISAVNAATKKEKAFDTCRVDVLKSLDGKSAVCVVSCDMFDYDVPRSPVGMKVFEAKRALNGLQMCVIDLKKAIAYAEKNDGKEYEAVKI